jgi:methylglyoxal synthase
MEKQKRIALIAHDNKKDDLLSWVKENREILAKHFLSGTGTTAKIISEGVELPVRAFKSGPLGGDQQIGARIVEGNIDMMIFFWDPLEGQPHDPDVKALLRIAVLYDIPVANNRATADFILSSHLIDYEYEREVVDFYKVPK